jgi:hypothetical protein
MADRACVVCGAPFPAVRNVKTCSPECAAGNRRRVWREKASRYRADPRTRERLLTARSAAADPTRATRRREARKAARRPKRCVVCGGLMRDRYNAKTCSPACRAKHRRAARLGKYHGGLSTARSRGVVCPVCGVLHCPLGRGRRKTCSDACSWSLRRAWVERYLSQHEVRARYAEYQRASARRRHGRKAAGEVAALAEAVAERSGGRSK